MDAEVKIPEAKILEHPTLEEYRGKIRTIDRDIIHYLKERHKSSRDLINNNGGRGSTKDGSATYAEKFSENFIQNIGMLLETWMPLGPEDTYLDDTIMQYLYRRFEWVKLVGSYKKQHNEPALQPQQWEKVKKTRQEMARDIGFIGQEKWIDEFLEIIHEYSLYLEEEIIHPSQGLPQFPNAAIGLLG